MRTTELNDRPFTRLLGELRVISNEMRQINHKKIINWTDYSPMRDGSVAEALVMVLPTAGCKYALAKHGGCSMCTLPMDNPLRPSEETIKAFPEMAWDLFVEKGGSERFKAVKFYTSGSFLDKWELPVGVREAVLTKFVDHVDEITVETRCEFVIKKNLDSILKVVPNDKIIIAIG